jgi:hypothetical protein
MITATIQTAAGTVTLEGDAAEIGQALASLGASPRSGGRSILSGSLARRGPGRPRKDAGAGGNGQAVQQARPRKPVSAAVARKRQIQGQYMGTIRSLPPAEKKRVQAIAQEKGVVAGLKEAKAILAKTKKK